MRRRKAEATEGECIFFLIYANEFFILIVIGDSMYSILIYFVRYILQAYSAHSPFPLVTSFSVPWPLFEKLPTNVYGASIVREVPGDTKGNFLEPSG